MALRKIVTVGDPILTKVCRPVTKFDQKLAILIEDMIETMHDANGVGLAGPQVGILRRVVVVDAGDEDIELVNPEVVEVSEETQTGLEGCLSLPGKYGIVTRPEHVVVRAQDRNGDWYEYEGDEILARCFLHEIDHLDGHMYTEIAEKMLTPEELAQKMNEASPSAFKILLGHRNYWMEKYPELPVDLVLCGHAHGGLVRIPGAGGLIGTDRHLFPDFVDGEFNNGNYTMIVSRGLGNSVPIPRIFNRPEIVCVTLRAE